MNKESTINLHELPRVNIGRSIIPKNHGHKTSFNVGQVIPIMVEEILPGSTYDIRTSCVARLQTLLAPIMDNVYMDIGFWFVPNRLVWEKWQQFCGENDEGPWTTRSTTYQVPYIKYPTPGESSQPVGTNGWNTGTIADYMGIPVGYTTSVFSGMSDKNYPMALPFRAYAMIIDQFWRDQNIQQPVSIHKDSLIRFGANEMSNGYVTELELGGRPFVACRPYSYFSSCLPAPQKSPDVSIFGGFNTGEPGIFDNFGPFAPVITKNVATWNPSDTRSAGLTKKNSMTGFLISYGADDPIFGANRYAGTSDASSADLYAYPSANELTDTHAGFIPANLWADLNIPEATISNLRMAFQLQKYYEACARGGTRYREYLLEMFGIENGDARMQVPEYLGGHRFPLSIHQVANTSETDSAKLGDLGAMSNTFDVHDDVHHSFTEHGFLIGLCCVRYDNTFSQGLERFWSRRDILDFYNPIFANISDQPVYKRELSLGLLSGSGETPVPDQVFGYNPAWQEYRVKPSRVSGEMRPEVTNSLASWHLADDYEYAPTLSPEWIQVDKSNVDRVLAVTSSVSNQVFADFWFDMKAVLPMPVHSIPGLADHH